MAEVIKNRTIRPSSRLETSRNYKVDTKKISGNDILIVNINHETKTFSKTKSQALFDKYFKRQPNLIYILTKYQSGKYIYSL